MIFRDGSGPRRAQADGSHDWVDVAVAPNRNDPSRSDPSRNDLGPGDPSGLPRALAVVALVAALVAVVLTGLWLQHRTRVIVAVTQVVPSHAATVDATGCPVDVTCGMSPDAGGPLETAYSTLFADADVISAWSVFAAATGKSYRAEIVLRTPASVLVSVFAQCIPGGAAVATVHGPIPALGPADAVAVTPGTPGCSVSVTIHAPAYAFIPVATIRALAGDQSVQLHL